MGLFVTAEKVKLAEVAPLHADGEEPSVIVGEGVTFTLTVLVAVQPAVFVPVTVYMVLLVAVTEGDAIAAFVRPKVGNHAYVDAPEAVSGLPGAAEQRFIIGAETAIVGVEEIATEKIAVALQIAVVPVTV